MGGFLGKTTMRIIQNNSWMALLGSVGFCCTAAVAGTFDLNFNSDPSAVLNINSNVPEPWRSTGGNPASGGYLAITDSVNSQSTVIVFDDFDKGLIVKSFKFSMDLRIGNPVGNGGRPADGFSVNYARANDPVVGGAGAGGFAAGGAPETGTTTGIAISFDTWTGNALPDGPDIEGIIVRVDNKTILRHALPTRNGAATDATSLQTGPWVDGSEGAFDGLTWQRFEMDLDDDAKLTVKWKGKTILDKVQTTFYPSPGRIVFAGRTGGANENTHVDNLHIETFAASKALLSGVTDVSATGFTVGFADSGASIVDDKSIAVQLDGKAITPVSTTVKDGLTSLRFENTGEFYASGSAHTINATFKDKSGAAISGIRPFTIPAYGLIKADTAATGATGSGMKARIHQIAVGRGPGDANSTLNAETQLADGFEDPTTGKPYPNIADLSSATKGIFDVLTVNWDQDGGAQGNFSNNQVDANLAIGEELIPGIPGTEGGTDNIVGEILTYLELKKGSYVMGVNSDDGFRVSTGPGAGDVAGTVLGEFSGGRGASDTLFNIAVEKDGVYPFRLTWWEGGGGANVEWFTVAADGTKHLINYTADAKAVKAFKTAKGRAYVKWLAGLPGRAEFHPTSPLKAVLVDDATSVVSGSIKLTVDGVEVTPSITKSGSETTVSYLPGTAWSPKRYSANLTYKESTTPESTRSIDFQFQPKITPADLPATSFSIEAEHFDNNGVAVSSVSKMPYDGGEYDGQGGILGVDYNNNNEADSDLYRKGEDAGVNIAETLGNRWGRQRPGFDVNVNHRIGWVAGGEWYNYTRTIPAGLYKAYAALSYDGTANGQLVASLSQVTAGVGTKNQTVVGLGNFNAPGSGGWGPNDLVPLRRAFDGSEAVLKFNGKTTLRFDVNSGDFDWFTLAPVTGVAPAVSSANIGYDKILRGSGALKFEITDYSAALDPASVKLSVDGKDVSAGVKVTKSGEVSTVEYADAAKLVPVTKHTYSITFKDTSGNAGSTSGEFIATPQLAGSFVIEAEDFNFGAGKHQAAADKMPYAGKAYDNLDAISDVDYHNPDGNDSDVYRKGENPNVNINENGGFSDRGSFSVTANYKIGWIGDGDWMNYTRVIPNGNYEVYAALSFDGRDPGQLKASLQKVTSSAAQPNQTTENLGTFEANGSGGWGNNNFVPLMNNGQRAVLALGGETTLRFNAISGDFDYFLLTPSGGAATGGGDRPKLTSIKVSGANVVVEWTGGGTLQVADEITGPWADVAGATSPLSTPITGSKRFARIKK